MDKRIKMCRVVLIDILKYGKNMLEDKDDFTEQSEIVEIDDNKLKPSISLNPKCNRSSETTDPNKKLIEDGDMNQIVLSLKSNKAPSSELQSSVSEENIMLKNMKVVSMKHRVKRRKGHLTFRKSSKRKRSTNAFAQNQAKKLLLWKYGETLLRKSSLSVDICEEDLDSSYKLQQVEDISMDQEKFCETGEANQTSTETKLQSKSNECLLRLDLLGEKPFDDNLQNVTFKEKACFIKQDFNKDSTISLSDKKPGPSPEVIQGDLNLYYTNPLCTMPLVCLPLNVGIGHSLKPTQVKCVLNSLDKCRNSISPQFAKFCSSVVKSSSISHTERVVLPIYDERVINFMQSKWNSKTAVKMNFNCPTLCDKKVHSVVANGSSLSVPCHSVPLETKIESCAIKNVSKLIFQQGSQNRGKDDISKTLVLSEDEISFVKRRRKKHLNLCRSSADFDYKNEPTCVSGQRVTRKRRKRTTARSHPIMSVNEDQEQTTNEGMKFDSASAEKRRKISLLSSNKESHMNATHNSIIEGDPENVRKRHSINYCRLKESQVGNSKADSDEDSRFVTFDTVKAPYDPDDTRGSETFEAILSEPKDKPRDKSLLMHELRRLNVALFDMTNCAVSAACCSPEICRLGCVCSSLSADVVRDNCGLVKCMFGCVCLDPFTIRRENESFTWMQKKAKANLAKEEKHFKQTVIRSRADNVIHFEGKRKREIKLPKRYQETELLEPFLRNHKKASKCEAEAGVNVHSPPKTEKKIKAKSDLQKQIYEDSKKLCLTSQNIALVSHAPLDSVFTKNSVSATALSGFGSSSLDCSDIARTSRDIPKHRSWFAARTSWYVPKSRAFREDKLEELSINSACEKNEQGDQLKIVSSQTLSPADWDKVGSNSPLSKYEDSSCLFLFSKDYVNQEESKVVLLSWDALRNDIHQGNIFLWLKASLTKSKVYLTQSPIKPTESCVEIQSIDKSSETFKVLPFHLKSLRLDYTLGKDENKCTWIAKRLKSHWMIVGYLQPENSDEGDKKCESLDVEIMSSNEEDLPQRWWLMDITQDFDLIYFLDFKKAVTKSQVSTLVKLSNEFSDDENKIHRIVLNRRRPKIDPYPVRYPDFGVYTLPDRPTEVLIGPYNFSKEPLLRVYSQKIAVNGKEEFEALPLFCISETECVRVNSKGALSLNSESPPATYIKGSWIPVCSKKISESHKQMTSKRSRKTEQLKSSDETSNSSEYDSDVVMDPASNISDLNFICKEEDGMNDRNKTQFFNQMTHQDSDKIDKISLKSTVSTANRKHTIDLLEGMSSENKCDTNESFLSVRLRKKGTTQDSVPALPKSNIVPQCHLARKRDKAKQHKQDRKGMKPSINLSDCVEKLENEKGVGMEYLVPSVEEIGVLTLTHLPGGTISVPHFTEPGLLKFYHSTEEVVRDINSLIHQKLSCMSHKCSVLLRDEENCKCVAWVSVLNKKRCENLPNFTSEIFNGFFMLTKFGLVDLRLLDNQTARKMGRDWIEWLKNDEVKVKLDQWKSQEDDEVKKKRKKLMEVLNKGEESNLPLHQILVMATNEIARLKAECQLLDVESQTHQLMRETLIHSLCKKFSGMPRKVMPHFLSQFDLDVFWEILECLEKKKSSLSIEISPNPPPTNQRTFENEDLLEDDASSSSRCKRKVAKDTMNKEALCSGTAEEDMAASLHSCNQILQQQQMVAENKKQHEDSFWDHFLSKFDEDQNPSPKLIRETPSSLIVKPPIILRKGKSQPNVSFIAADTAVSPVSQVQRQGRKQTFSFSTETNEEPIFIEESLSPPKTTDCSSYSRGGGFSRFPTPIGTDDINHAFTSTIQTAPTDARNSDPISSLCISSVESGVNTFFSPEKSEYSEAEGNLCVSSVQSPVNTIVSPEKSKSPESEVGLRISSVQSGVNFSFTPEKSESSEAEVDLHISSVQSGVKNLFPSENSGVETGLNTSLASSERPSNRLFSHSPSVVLCNAGLKAVVSPPKSSTGARATLVGALVSNTVSNQLKGKVLLKASPSFFQLNAHSKNSSAISVVLNNSSLKPLPTVVLKPKADISNQQFVFDGAKLHSKPVMLSSIAPLKTSVLSTSVGNIKPSHSQVPKKLKTMKIVRSFLPVSSLQKVNCKRVPVSTSEVLMPKEMQSSNLTGISEPVPEDSVSTPASLAGSGEAVISTENITSSVVETNPDAS